MIPKHSLRPIYEDIKQLSDPQLSIMCQSHNIDIGPITRQNRRLAEWNLHVALIGERAKIRAKEQYARELQIRLSYDNPRSKPPPQQHYTNFSVPEVQSPPPQTYWPTPGSFNERTSPRSNRHIDPSRYRPCDSSDRGPNILGFQMPFSLNTARQYSVKIGETLRRFQGGGEETTSSGKNTITSNEAAHGETSQSQDNQNMLDMYQDSYQNHNRYLDSEDEASIGDPLEDSDYQSSHESERDTLSERSFCNLRLDKKLHSTVGEDLRPVENFVRPATHSNAPPRVEFASMESPSIYHDFPILVPMEPISRPAERISWASPFRWFWRWQGWQTVAGPSQGIQFQPIPAAERTREREAEHELELNTINYLEEGLPPGVRDEIVELMSKVPLREASEDEDERLEGEEVLVTQRSPIGFIRHLIHLMLCDHRGTLDGEKVRCSFLCCCLAVCIYMGFRLVR
ncbi:uncharacterized protein [Drosophila bipectinata]|uniref:uncharacterized protein n=1 Tax=Drosophila bipectinata TaxID=42026 RepID=UPI001C8A04D9|nr:uncharacterized protein LOC108124324 [Drosophila bipectinata]